MTDTSTRRVVLAVLLVGMAIVSFGPMNSGSEAYFSDSEEVGVFASVSKGVAGGNEDEVNASAHGTNETETDSAATQTSTPNSTVTNANQTETTSTTDTTATATETATSTNETKSSIANPPLPSSTPVESDGVPPQARTGTRGGELP